MPDTAKMEATVHAYVAAFGAGDPDQAAALFAEDATVEDPVGTPVHKGREAIRAFYAASMKTGAKLKLEGPIRIAADYAVFPFSANLDLGAGKGRVDVIDTFRFNEANEVVEMRAFFGPANMHGL